MTYKPHFLAARLGQSVQLKEYKSKLLMKLHRMPKQLCAPLSRGTGTRRGNRLQDRVRQQGGSSPSQALLEQIGRTG